MAASNPDVSVTGWTDLVATYPGMTSVASYVQCKGPCEIVVMFSASGTAPSDNSGMLLARGDYADGTAAHIWVRSLGNGPAAVASGVMD